MNGASMAHEWRIDDAKMRRARLGVGPHGFPRSHGPHRDKVKAQWLILRCCADPNRAALCEVEHRRNPRSAEVPARPRSLPPRRARVGDAGFGQAPCEALRSNHRRNPRAAETLDKPRSPSWMCFADSQPASGRAYGPPEGCPACWPMTHRVGKGQRHGNTEGTREPQRSWNIPESS
jgi:hypothetical protein